MLGWLFDACKINPTGLNLIWLSDLNYRIQAGTDQIVESPTKTEINLCYVEAYWYPDLVYTPNKLPIIGERKEKRKRKENNDVVWSKQMLTWRR